MNPVFVVGSPRSGTTLLAAMLASHPSFGCGPETHFFVGTSAHQRQRAAVGEWPYSAMHLLSQLTLEDASLTELFGHDQEGLFRTLAARPPSEGAMLEALTASFAARLGKPRWIEKTPNHLLHIREIVKAFPDAVFVRIMRDPRASAHSMKALPFASQSFLANCVRWMNGYVYSRPFFRAPGPHFTLRYEDLVANPEAELRRLCSFLGEPYDPAMLEHQHAARLLQTPAESWKLGSTQPLSAGGIDRWRSEVPPEEQDAAALFLKPALDEFGYPGGIEASRLLPMLGLTGRIADGRLDLLMAAARSRTRVELLPEPLMNVRPLFASFDLRAHRCGRTAASFMARVCLALLRGLARGETARYLTPAMAPRRRILNVLRWLAAGLGRAITVHEALQLATPATTSVTGKAARSANPKIDPRKVPIFTGGPPTTAGKSASPTATTSS